MRGGGGGGGGGGAGQKFKVTRAYVCMKISEYRPGAVASYV